MKKQILKLGKILEKPEQKMIHGGSEEHCLAETVADDCPPDHWCDESIRECIPCGVQGWGFGCS
jgi:hypothetical protein